MPKSTITSYVYFTAWSCYWSAVLPRSGGIHLTLPAFLPSHFDGSFDSSIRRWSVIIVSGRFRTGITDIRDSLSIRSGSHGDMSVNLLIDCCAGLQFDLPFDWGVNLGFEP